MKKLLILLAVIAVFKTVSAQETAIVIPETAKQKQINNVEKISNPTQPFVWKENGTGTSNEWIAFSENFSKGLNGKQAFILITPTSGNEGFYVKELTDKGFKVTKGPNIKTDKEFRFCWQAEISTLQLK